MQRLITALPVSHAPIVPSAPRLRSATCLVHPSGHRLHLPLHTAKAWWSWAGGHLLTLDAGDFQLVRLCFLASLLSCEGRGNLVASSIHDSLPMPDWMFSLRPLDVRDRRHHRLWSVMAGRPSESVPGSRLSYAPPPRLPYCTTYQTCTHFLVPLVLDGLHSSLPYRDWLFVQLRLPNPSVFHTLAATTSNLHTLPKASRLRCVVMHFT